MPSIKRSDNSRLDMGTCFSFAARFFSSTRSYSGSSKGCNGPPPWGATRFDMTCLSFWVRLLSKPRADMATPYSLDPAKPEAIVESCRRIRLHCNLMLLVVRFCRDTIMAQFGKRENLGRRAAKPISGAGLRCRHGSPPGSERRKVAPRPKSAQERRIAQAQRQSPGAMGDDCKWTLANLFPVPPGRCLRSRNCRLPQRIEPCRRLHILADC